MFSLLLELFLPRAQDVIELELLTPPEFIEIAQNTAKKRDLKNNFLKTSIPIQSLFPYHTPIVQQAIWNLKYKGNKKVAALCAAMLYENIVETLRDTFQLSSSLPILIPLPISKQRLKERGWNQTEMLAYELSSLDLNKHFKVNCNILSKVRHTSPQTKLNRKERLENLKSCFAVSNPDLIKNKNIILLDDVTTTGSTINEAVETLKNAGATRIIAFTIAR